MSSSNPIQSFISGYQSGLDIQERRARLADFLEQAPIRQQERQLDLGLRQQQLQAGQAQSQLQQSQLQMQELQNALQKGTILNQTIDRVAQQFQDPQSRYNFAQKNATGFAELGLDVNQLTLNDFTNEGLMRNKSALQQSLGRAEQALTAGQREFQSLTAGLPQEDIERAKRIKLGLDQRAGVLSRTERAAMDEGLKERLAGVERTLAMSKEEGKLLAQAELEPEVKAKVTAALEQVKSDADIASTQRSNQAAYKVYQTAMQNISNSLGATNLSGPVFGLIPAMTTESKIADGAKAIMAPVLKQIFRVAGEGTFTDRDQALLLEMVPTRTDTKESAAAKMEMINAVIESKLGRGQSAQPVQQPARQQMPVQRPTPQAPQQQGLIEGQTATNPQTGQRVIFRNGQWQAF